MAASANHLEDRMVIAHSTRNRFPGLVTRIVHDTVMAQIDIQAGPHRFVSLLSREAACRTVLDAILDAHCRI
jgi:molybdopterin-binding protein